MTEYIQKYLDSDNYDDESKKALEHEIVTRDILDEDATINTEYGDVSVTKGNYVLTTRSGRKYSVTPTDFDLRYTEWTHN